MDGQTFAIINTGDFFCFLICVDFTGWQVLNKGRVIKYPNCCMAFMTLYLDKG